MLPSPAYLLQQQLPIYPHRSLPILLRVFPQSPTHLPHPLQTVPSIQQILNILRHYLRHILELTIQLVQITRRPRIAVRLLRSLHKRVEFHKRIGP